MYIFKLVLKIQPDAGGLNTDVTAHPTSKTMLQGNKTLKTICKLNVVDLGQLRSCVYFSK